MMNVRVICLFALLQLLILSVTADSAEFPKQKVLNKKMEVHVEEDPVFHKMPLFYYKKFASGLSKTGLGLSMNDLYEQERALRQKIDENNNKIDTLKRKRGIAKRDATHNANVIQDKKLKTRERLHQVAFVDTQRETAIKFEINHDEMWKAYYLKRKAFNNNRLKTAFRAQLPSIKKLIANDKMRMRMYHKDTMQQWQLLQDLKNRQNTDEMKLKNETEM